MSERSLPWCWGARPGDLAEHYPCAGRVPEPVITLYRAVSVAAPVATVFRWVCQTRAAPYSYDLLDNWGRRSPRELTPGLDELAVGQDWMVFAIADFETGRQVTGEALPGPAKVFGPMAVTYLVRPVDEYASRLVVRLDVGIRGPLGRAKAYALAWGDLVMMRKQLLTLRDLAERTANR